MDDLRQRIEALIGGPTPPVLLSDRPNKIVRVQHRDDRLCAEVTESMVRVSDIVAALAAPPAGDPAHDQYLTSLDGSVRCICGASAPFGADAIKWHHAHLDEASMPGGAPVAAHACPGRRCSMCRGVAP